MHLSRIPALLLGSLCFGATGWGADVVVQSGPARVNLLELYTSEGCSSCPTAEAWLSGLRGDRRLWKDVVPVAFHVDYWNNLGWTDAFSTRAYSDRQRAYSAAWGTRSIYTPGFVVNGQEWRGHTWPVFPAAQGDAGKLSGTLRPGGEVEIAYPNPAAQACAALLGFAAATEVKGGENGGKHLVHDFVVLGFQAGPMTGGRAVLKLPPALVKHGLTALAVWVTGAAGPEPLQAAGGDL